MAIGPIVRDKLGNISSKNKSLQDIFRTMKQGLEILEVKEHTHGIHNTMIKVKVDLGEGLPDRDRYQNRVHFYNRLNLAVVLANITWSANTLPEIIKELNLKGCDFNSDDLELSGTDLKAKLTSLGYYGQTGSSPEPEECYCVMDHQSLNSVQWNMELETMIGYPGSDALYPVSRIEAIFTVNEVEVKKDFTPMEVQSYRQILDKTKSLFANSLNITNTDDADNFGFPSVENLLTDKCNNFGLKLRYYSSSDPRYSQYYIIPEFELCPKGTQKISCTGKSKKASLNFLFFQRHFIPEGSFIVVINGAQFEYPVSVNYEASLALILDDVAGRYLWSFEPFMQYYDGENIMENMTQSCLDVTIKFKETGGEEKQLFHTLMGTVASETLPNESSTVVIPSNWNVAAE